MRAEHQFLTLSHEEDKLIVFEKGPVMFIFNFHTSKSFEDYRVGTLWGSDHMILLDTDKAELGGHGRLNSGYLQRYVPRRGQWQDRPNSISLYLPCRTAIILIAEENLTADMRERGQIEMPAVRQQQTAI